MRCTALHYTAIYCTWVRFPGKRGDIQRERRGDRRMNARSALGGEGGAAGALTRLQSGCGVGRWGGGSIRTLLFGIQGVGGWVMMGQQHTSTRQPLTSRQ